MKLWQRIKALLPRQEMGNLEIPVFWPLRWPWLGRQAWWAALPAVMAWCPIGLLLHFPVMAVWWEEERQKAR